MQNTARHLCANRINLRRIDEGTLDERTQSRLSLIHTFIENLYENFVINSSNFGYVFTDNFFQSLYFLIHFVLCEKIDTSLLLAHPAIWHFFVRKMQDHNKLICFNRSINVAKDWIVEYRVAQDNRLRRARVLKSTTRCTIDRGLDAAWHT